MKIILCVQLSLKTPFKGKKKKQLLFPQPIYTILFEKRQVFYYLKRKNSKVFAFITSHYIKQLVYDPLPEMLWICLSYAY